MWRHVFSRMLTQLIVNGTLRITYPDGSREEFGLAGQDEVHVTLHTSETLRALCLRPELALGEAYMDGRLTIENDDLDGLIRLVVRNQYAGQFPVWQRSIQALRVRARGWMMRNTPGRARQNVAHHYDLSDDLYRLFLDDDMQYSCAYFTDPDMSLEDAQVTKKAHIAAKLRLEPGLRVLDIGCGWGGMALTLARDYGVHVTGVTLSQNQLATARTRARQAGMEDCTDFRLCDYRQLTDRFDRIVSVGMLEHVGLPHYPEYFEQVARLLAPDGVALVHTIGRCAPPMAPAQWIGKYIFPGGYVPSLSELAGPIEQAGLWHMDLEVWRVHYATTLRHWRDRFYANVETIRKTYDARFIRMWRYYLTVCILAFEEQHQAVFHFQMAHRRDAVPLTRDYLYRDPDSARRAAE